MTALPDNPFDDLDPHAVLTVTEIAQRVAAHPRTVRRAVACGELIASRACGIRILASDAAAWWRATLVTTAPETVRAESDPPRDLQMPRADAEPAVRRRRTLSQTAAPVGRLDRSPGRVPLPPRASRS